MNEMSRLTERISKGQTQNMEYRDEVENMRRDINLIQNQLEDVRNRTLLKFLLQKIRKHNNL